MNLSIEEAKEFVRARLDELSQFNSALLADAEDDRNLGLTIEKLLPEAIEAVHLAAPASLMEGPTIDESVADSYPESVTLLKGGVLDIDLSLLPEGTADMLRLISFIAEDSDVLLTESFHESTPRARMQLNKYIQGKPDDPVLVQMDDSPEHKFHYRYYTTKLSQPKFRLRYFPMPSKVNMSFNVSTKSLVAPVEGGTLSFKITCDTGWHIQYGPGDHSWMTLDKGTGSGSATIHVTFFAANDFVRRENTLSVVSDKGEIATIQVGQASPLFLLSTKAILFDGNQAGYTKTLTVTLNPNVGMPVNVNYQTGEGAAFDYSVGDVVNNTMVISVKPKYNNTSTADYEDIISISRASQIESVYVTQEVATIPVVNIIPDELEFPADNLTPKIIKITSNWNLEGLEVYGYDTEHFGVVFNPNAGTITIRPLAGNYTGEDLYTEVFIMGYDGNIDTSIEVVQKGVAVTLDGEFFNMDFEDLPSMVGFTQAKSLTSTIDEGFVAKLPNGDELPSWIQFIYHPETKKAAFRLEDNMSSTPRGPIDIRISGERSGAYRNITLSQVEYAKLYLVPGDVVGPVLGVVNGVTAEAIEMNAYLQMMNFLPTGMRSVTATIPTGVDWVHFTDGGVTKMYGRPVKVQVDSNISAASRSAIITLEHNYQESTHTLDVTIEQAGVVIEGTLFDKSFADCPSTGTGFGGTVVLSNGASETFSGAFSGNGGNWCSFAYVEGPKLYTISVNPNNTGIQRTTVLTITGTSSHATRIVTIIQKG